MCIMFKYARFFSCIHQKITVFILSQHTRNVLAKRRKNKMNQRKILSCKDLVKKCRTYRVSTEWDLLELIKLGIRLQMYLERDQIMLSQLYMNNHFNASKWDLKHTSGA